MNLTVIPLTSRKKTEKFCFFDELKNIIKSSKVVIKEGDILVISSKFISNSQGRILEIEKYGIYAGLSDAEINKGINAIQNDDWEAQKEVTKSIYKGLSKSSEWNAI